MMIYKLLVSSIIVFATEVPLEKIGINRDHVKIIRNQGGDVFSIEVIKPTTIKSVKWLKGDRLYFGDELLDAAYADNGVRLVEGIKCYKQIAFDSYYRKLAYCTLGEEQMISGVKWPKGTYVEFYPQHKGTHLGNAGGLTEDVMIEGVLYKKGESAHFNWGTKKWEKGVKALVPPRPGV